MIKACLLFVFSIFDLYGCIVFLLLIMLGCGPLVNFVGLCFSD
jgi:hypothetical protein